jgi:hypothetical protein
MTVEVRNGNSQETSDLTHVRIQSDSLFPISTPLKLKGSALQTSVTPSSLPPRSPQGASSKSDFHFETGRDESHSSTTVEEKIPETSPENLETKEFSFPITLSQQNPSGTSGLGRGQFGGFVSRRGGRTGSPIRPKQESEPSLPILCPQLESSSSPENPVQPLNSKASADTPSLISYISDGSPLKNLRNSKPEDQNDDVPPSNMFSSVSQKTTEESQEGKDRIRSPPPSVCFAEEHGGAGHNRYLSGVPMGDLKLTSPCVFSPFLNVTDSPMPSSKLTPVPGKSCIKSPKLKDFPRTPTNYGLLNGSFDTPNNVKCLDTPSAFSWLQSPNPGLLSSTTDLCGSTPVSHFFKEVGGLDDTSREPSSTAPNFSQICISPLASSRRSSVYNASHTLALLRSPKSPKMSLLSSSQIDKMMPMDDDDDLNILLELASQTHDVLRSPVVQQDYQKLTAADTQKTSLQLPIMNSSESRALPRKPPKSYPSPFGVNGSNSAPAKLPPSKCPVPIKSNKKNSINYHVPPEGQYTHPRGIPPNVIPRGHLPAENSIPITFPSFPNPGAGRMNPNPNHIYSGTPNQSTAPSSGSKPLKKRASPKREKKSPSSSKKYKMSSPPIDAKAKAAAADLAAAKAGTSTESAAALAAAIMRGVTMRPSGKWQAQLYYAGKSRYIGVFDSREKAALAYEIAREHLKADPKETVNQDPDTTEAKVNQARKAAFEGVNEPDPKQTKKK